MNQQKVGQFLKELRSKKALTQEQLAKTLGVSNRSISRWENGITMPDFDLLIQMAKFYDVEIGEILDGERKSENMDTKTEETLLKVADYTNAEKREFPERIRYLFLTGLACMLIYISIDIFELSQVQPYKTVADFALGLVTGGLITGMLYTSRRISQIRVVKMRLLDKLKYVNKS